MDFEQEVVTSEVRADVFGGLTVGEAINPQGFSAHLRPDDCLGDAADVLSSSKRTAMGVTAVEHDVLGMITVNDVMRAFFEGVPAKTKLSDWLQSTVARAPENLLKRLEVQPDTPLSEVVEKMVANAVRGDLASHHILVKEADGILRGVISSHDLLEAFRHHDMWHSLMREYRDLEEEPEEPECNDDAEERVASMLVKDIMKPRDGVFACEPTDTLKSALKTLLVTRQNFLLVASSAGIFGFISARDMVKAFADAVPVETTVADFLRTQPAEKTHRTIASDARVIDAVNDMSIHEVDHLVVLRPDDSEAVGVVSSLDLMLHVKAPDFTWQTPTWSGPTVGEVLEEHAAQTALCTNETLLSMVCARLVAAGQTSVLVGDGTEARGVLTESDLVRAFVNDFYKEDTVGDLLIEFGEHQVPHYLQVAPSMPLTDAAAMMLHASQPGHSCHHLVVRAVTGGWRGVFSALDVARALHHMSSQLDIARLGVDVLKVGDVMKPAEAVPTCATSETLKDVLSQFQEFGQTALVVMEGQTALGLITPRCALHGLATGVTPTITVGEWMRTRQLPEGPREVTPETSIIEAAAVMAELGLHHLLVVEELGGAPAGVLSALDVVRGVVSMHEHRPFLTLNWLRRVGVPTNFAPEARAVRKHKRSAGRAEGAPAKKARHGEDLPRRAEECGA